MDLRPHFDTQGAGRLFFALARIIGIVQGLALIGIVTLILSSIILRNFFDYGLVWVFEATGFLMVTLVFLGVAKNLYFNDDIAVDFVTARVGRRLQIVAWYFRKILILVVSALIVYHLIQHNLRFGHLRTPTLEMSHWFFYGAVIVGPGLAVLIVLWHLSLGLRRKAGYDRI